jgi:L-ribulose-5-phosphate 4-epimerase
MSIPCSLTSTADEFGGDVPCADYACIGGEDIADSVLRKLNDRYCAAVLLKSHGVFTFGETLEKAVKAAVMVEDAAHITWMAALLAGGPPPRLSQNEIDLAHKRYTTAYGQRHD